MGYHLQLYNNTFKAFNDLPITKSLFNAKLPLDLKNVPK